MNRMSLTKYTVGQKNRRGVVVDKTTINLFVASPTPEVAEILKKLGYRTAANENGAIDAMEIDCYTPADVDAARNPLIGLVRA